MNGNSNHLDIKSRIVTLRPPRDKLRNPSVELVECLVRAFFEDALQEPRQSYVEAGRLGPFLKLGIGDEATTTGPDVVERPPWCCVAGYHRFGVEGTDRKVHRIMRTGTTVAGHRSAINGEGELRMRVGRIQNAQALRLLIELRDRSRQAGDSAPASLGF